MRCFLAIDLPPALKSRIAELTASLRETHGRLRWVRAGSLHLTLHFLGERAPAAAERLSGALRPVFAALPRLELRLAGAGGFPERRPKVLWLGVEDSGLLASLHARTMECLAAVGNPTASAEVVAPQRAGDERRFHPHLTLARARGHGVSQRWVLRLAESLEALAGERFTVEETLLLESHLGPGGAVYKPIARFPLRHGESL